ncbi:hypothetical protein SEA_POLYYUKI_3 [Rhodococcus phage Polyyuki]|nr:hypothetical protein SEA_POLYYUKI_3 [Rhodococcus phage Polyyuki]
MYERQQAKANIDAMVAHLDAGIALIQARQVELSAAKHLLFEQREQYAAMGRAIVGEAPPDATPEEAARAADVRSWG